MASTIRARDVRSAFALEIFTIAYMIFEVAAAHWLGIITGSISLQAFGLHILIEIAAALVPLWRLNAELCGTVQTS